MVSSVGLVKKKGGNGSETEVEGCGEEGVCKATATVYGVQCNGGWVKRRVKR
jgi:hypothetical protein